MLAGWYDVVLPQMLTDYQLLLAGGQQARLTIGGWHHTSQELFRQELADALDWFGTHLLGRPPAERARLQVEVMGGGGWRDLAGWPPPGATRRWHLHPGGALAQDAPPDGEPDRYVYDPADPTPAVGGTSVMHCGPRDNRELEQRPDVLTYTSAPMDAPLVITGPVTVELFAGSSRRHTDFFARLCDVHPDGTSVNITDGIRRVGRRMRSAGPRHHRAVVHRAPVPARPPHPAAGVERCPPPLRAQPGRRRAAGHRGHDAHRAAGGLPRPGAPVRRAAARGGGGRRTSMT